MRVISWKLISLLLLMAAILCALCWGRYALGVGQVIGALLNFVHLQEASESAADVVVTQARLPRIIAAILVGSALSCGGAAYQAIFRNPLVSPDLLGVLSGAAFGASVMIVLGVPALVIQCGAFAGGLLAVGFGLAVSRMLPQGGLLTLLLGGLVANAVFTALLSLIKYTADPLEQLPAVINWLLGSLAQSNWQQLYWLSIPILILVSTLILMAPMLDVLSLDDDEAQSLGIPVRVMRFWIILVGTLACALTISMAGIIGWVGLLVPHIARLLVGPEHSRMMPVCALLGAAGMVMADTAARSMSSGEVPLGIMTELIGALAFVWVLRRMSRNIG